MPAVLVVDDSATDRCLAGSLLERKLGARVYFASDGTEAVALLKQFIPDLILTDLQMPEMSGLELVQFMKRQHPLLPVILMTAEGSEETAVQALQEGAASYVPKRNLVQEMPDIVERVLSAALEARTQVRLMSRLQKNEQEFVLDNELPLIRSLVSYLRQTLRNLRFPHETEHLRIGVALEEALLNAYYHGNLEVSSELRDIDHKAYYDLARERSQQLPYRQRRIFVKACITQQEATYVIRDEGPGFNSEERYDPTLPANLSRPSGRGLLLMRTFMDELIYNDTGNEVTLIKRRATDDLDGPPNEVS